MTGNNAKVAGGTLFTVSTSTAKTTELLALGGFGASGGCGQALGFDPADGLLHYMTTTAYLGVDTSSSAVTSLPFPAPLENSDCEDDEALAWWPAQSVFLVAYGYSAPTTLYTLDATGVASVVGPLDHVAKGLALVQGSASVTCTALDACHAAGTCDPSTGACSNPALPDGSPCPGGTCQVGACQIATCADGVQNQGETGVDCGGPCPPCGLCTSTLTSAAVSGFGYLGYLTVDAQGDVFVADVGNNQVHEVTPDGQVTTFGSGQYGYADGPAATAQFAGPEAVAVDAQGDVFVADSGNAVIRSIAPDGTVSTVAGTPGDSDHVDGPAASAAFVWPTDIHLDAQGNLYIVDYDDATVRLLDTSGNVTTIAGTPWSSGHADGPAASAQFAGLDGITIDAQGNLYVTEWDEHDIREDRHERQRDDGGRGARHRGRSRTALRRPRSSTASRASRSTRRATSSWSTTTRRRIREVTPGGSVSTIAGSAYNHDTPDGCAAHLPLDWPAGIAIAPDGTIHFTDNTSLRTIGRGRVRLHRGDLLRRRAEPGRAGRRLRRPLPPRVPDLLGRHQERGRGRRRLRRPLPALRPRDAVHRGRGLRRRRVQGQPVPGAHLPRRRPEPGRDGRRLRRPLPALRGGHGVHRGRVVREPGVRDRAVHPGDLLGRHQERGRGRRGLRRPLPALRGGHGLHAGRGLRERRVHGRRLPGPDLLRRRAERRRDRRRLRRRLRALPRGRALHHGRGLRDRGLPGARLPPRDLRGRVARRRARATWTAAGPAPAAPRARPCGTAADCASDRCVGGVCNPRPAVPPNDPTVPTDIGDRRRSSTAERAPCRPAWRRRPSTRGAWAWCAGSVIDRSGAPIPDVSLSVLGHPELGRDVHARRRRLRHGRERRRAGDADLRQAGPDLRAARGRRALARLRRGARTS